MNNQKILGIVLMLLIVNSPVFAVTCAEVDYDTAKSIVEDRLTTQPEFNRLSAEDQAAILEGALERIYRKTITQRYPEIDPTTMSNYLARFDSSKALGDELDSLRSLEHDEAIEKIRAEQPALAPEAPVEEVAAAQNYRSQMQSYNERLSEYDAADAKRRARKTLTAEEQAVLNRDKALADERFAFNSDNYQFHEVATALDRSSRTYQHLEAHLEGNEIGSVFTRGPESQFQTAEDIISFSEDVLGEAYKTGKVTSREGWTLRVIAGKPGSRLVIEAVADKPVGEDALVEITDANIDNVFEGKRTMGGRDQEVNLVEGAKKPTNKMYIIGGPYGPTGRYGLFTTYPGEYAPMFSPRKDNIIRMSGTEFWAKHAFIAEEAPAELSAGELGLLTSVYEDILQAESDLQNGLLDAAKQSLEKAQEGIPSLEELPKTKQVQDAIARFEQTQQRLQEAEAAEKEVRLPEEPLSEIEPSTKGKIEDRLSNLEALVTVSENTKRDLEGRVRPLESDIERETDPKRAVMLRGDLQYLLSNIFVYEQLEKVTNPKLREGRSIDDLAKALTDYHKGRVSRADAVSELEEILDSSESAEDVITKTVRPEVFVNTDFPHPVAITKIYGQTFVTALMEGENVHFILSTSDLTYAKLMRERGVFNPDKTLNEDNAREFLRYLTLSQAPGTKESRVETKVNSVLEQWKNYLETKDAKYLSGLNGLGLFGAIIEGNADELSFVEDLDADYGIAHSPIEGLRAFLDKLKETELTSTVVELEAPGAARRFANAMDLIRQGLLVEHDGIYEPIVEEYYDGAIKTASGKVLNIGEYSRVRAVNSKGERVDVKTIFRLHVNPKSLAVFPESEMNIIGEMSSKIPEKAKTGEMSDQDLADLITEGIMPIKSLLMEARSRYKGVEDDINTLERFVGAVTSKEEVSAALKSRTLSALGTLRKLHGDLTKNKRGIEEGLTYFDGFIAVSDQTKQLWGSYFTSLDPDKINVVQNELMYDLYDASPTEKRAKKTEVLSRLGIENPETKTVVSYVGRFEEQKGYFVLEDMMKQLADNPDIVFVIGSDGTGDKARQFQDFLANTDEGKKLVREGRVKVVTDISKFGHIIRQKEPADLEGKIRELERQYQGIVSPRFSGYPTGVHSVETDVPVQVISDIYVHPAKTEAIGLSIQEANIAGNYIVASKTGGIPQAVDRTQDTLAHRIEDAEGTNRIEKWEDSFAEFAGELAGQDKSIVIEGRAINLAELGPLEIITLLSENEGKGFELDGVKYSIGVNILIAEKEIQSLKSGTELEAEFYVNEILGFRERLGRGEVKETAVPEKNLLAASREGFLESMRAPPSVKIPREVPVKANPEEEKRLQKEIDDIHPREELLQIEGFNRRSLGNIGRFWSQEKEISVSDLEDIDVGIDKATVVEIFNRKLAERAQKEEEVAEQLKDAKTAYEISKKIGECS